MVLNLGAFPWGFAIGIGPGRAPMVHRHAYCRVYCQALWFLWDGEREWPSAVLDYRAIEWEGGRCGEESRRNMHAFVKQIVAYIAPVV